MPQLRLPILIVEDSPEDYEALVRAFAKVGIPNPVYRFSYGEDAYDFLKQRGRYFKHGAEERPGLLILDLNLPGTDGLRVLRGIREDEALRAIPVIILSTSSNFREIESCYLAGANSYMVKPSSPAEFVEAIRKLKEFWLEAATLPALAESAKVVVPKPPVPGRQPDPDEPAGPPTTAPPRLTRREAD
jgi:CheY-like chemotaxis protein